MAFLFAPAQTSPAQQNAPLSRIFIASWKTKCCRCCRCSNASRAWARKHACVVAILKATKKKKTIRKFFFLTLSSYGTNTSPQTHSFRFFFLSLVLSFSFSPVVVVAYHHPEERGVSLFEKNVLHLAFCYVYMCSLFFRSALNIFYSFSWERTDAFFYPLLMRFFSRFSTIFFIQKVPSVFCPILT